LPVSDAKSEQKNDEPERIPSQCFKPNAYRDFSPHKHLRERFVRMLDWYSMRISAQCPNNQDIWDNLISRVLDLRSITNMGLPLKS
jgi:hypothetical protein